MSVIQLKFPNVIALLSVSPLKSVSIYFIYLNAPKIMASGPITSWEIDGETVETVSDFIFLGSKITADGDCSHEIKTLAPWKESYDQPR